jgi:hypothetical protein
MVKVCVSVCVCVREWLLQFSTDSNQIWYGDSEYTGVVLGGGGGGGVCVCVCRGVRHGNRIESTRGSLASSSYDDSARSWASHSMGQNQWVKSRFGVSQNPLGGHNSGPIQTKIDTQSFGRTLDLT